MNQPKGGEPLTAEQRQALEATHTWQRVVELRLDPVRGNFDATHLKEVNRRIFQDLPGLGFVSFYGFNSWYSASSQLEPVFRLAKETGREVAFTADRGCNILSAELLPTGA